MCACPRPLTRPLDALDAGPAAQSVFSDSDLEESGTDADYAIIAQQKRVWEGRSASNPRDAGLARLGAASAFGAYPASPLTAAVSDDELVWELQRQADDLQAMMDKMMGGRAGGDASGAGPKSGRYVAESSTPGRRAPGREELPDDLRGLCTPPRALANSRRGGRGGSYQVRGARA